LFLHDDVCAANVLTYQQKFAGVVVDSVFDANQVLKVLMRFMPWLICFIGKGGSKGMLLERPHMQHDTIKGI